MRVKLKGLNRVSKRLADGTRATYYYAWKGGPRLPGAPGDPEFIAAYNDAVKQKAHQPTDTLQAVLNSYQDAPKFTDLAERTRKDYIRHIRQIEAKFGDLPIAALSDRRCRAEFLDWRDHLAKRSRRQADYSLATLASILAWALDRGMIPSNPCERPGKLYQSGRAASVWTAADEEAFMAVAPDRMRLAYMLAVWTGQRQGDLLRLTWSAYDGSHIRLRQQKSGRRVVIPVATALKAALDSKPRKTLTILSTTRGTPWTSDGFRTEWRKAAEKAQISGLTFHDLRGTAVTRFALGGSSEAEIATLTGHSLRDVAAILDTHYLSRDARLAESAMRKREAHEAGTDFPNRAPNCSDLF